MPEEVDDPLSTDEVFVEFCEHGNLPKGCVTCRLEADDPYALVPEDFEALLAEGIPETEYVYKPYIPKGARVWFWGPTGTAKSMYALWLGAKLSREGFTVAYFSEENPKEEDLRRIGLLKPEAKFFRWFPRKGLDLTDPEWVAHMLEATTGCDIVVFDTWTDCWYGDENSNQEVRDFDAKVLKPLQAQGATPIVIHHTGHGQANVIERKAASAGRGASTLGQKADVTLHFKPEANADGDDAFQLVYGKARLGGERPGPKSFRVVGSNEEGFLDIVEIEGQHTRTVLAMVAAMKQYVFGAAKGYLTTTELRADAGGSVSVQKEAMELLKDDPDIIYTPNDKVLNASGKYHVSKTWRPATARLV